MPQLGSWTLFPPSGRVCQWDRVRRVCHPVCHLPSTGGGELVLGTGGPEGEILEAVPPPPAPSLALLGRPGVGVDVGRGRCGGESELSLLVGAA